MSLDDDEKLLRDLGRAVHAEEHTPLQTQLEKLSAGQLSADELARLSAQARDDAGLARALEAYAPISASVKAQIAARALAAARARTPDDESQDEEPEGDETVAPVSLAAHRARRLRALWTAVPLAAAAAVAMLWLGREDRQVAPLPEYLAQVAGGAAVVRAAPAPASGVSSEELAPVRVAPDTRLKIALRPATNAGASVQARVYLITSAGVQTWPSETVQADSGAVQLVLAPVPAVIGSAAAAAIIVARGDVLEKRGEELVRVPQARGPGYQRWRLPLLPVVPPVAPPVLPPVLPSDTKE